MTTDEREALRNRLLTQDNLLTEHPLYVVYDKMTIFGLDCLHADRFVWVNDEYREADGETLDTITHAVNEYEDAVTIAGIDYHRIGVRYERRFITACLTMESAKQFIEYHTHRLIAPVVYVESLSGNPEMIGLRDHLMQEPK